MSGFVCVYFGRSDECPECGGFNDTGHRYCSHECAANHAERVRRLDAIQQARRDEEDAFGREVDRLRALGYSYEEMDALLAGEVA